MPVSLRFRISKFCSLLISSGTAEKITLSVAWVLHRAGSYSPAKLEQQFKSSDVSDLQSPIDGVNAVTMTSDVAWVLQRAGSLTRQVAASFQIDACDASKIFDETRELLPFFFLLPLQFLHVLPVRHAVDHRG